VRPAPLGVSSAVTCSTAGWKPHGTGGMRETDKEQPAHHAESLWPLGSQSPCACAPTYVAHPLALLRFGAKCKMKGCRRCGWQGWPLAQCRLTGGGARRRPTPQRRRTLSGLASSSSSTIASWPRLAARCSGVLRCESSAVLCAAPPVRACGGTRASEPCLATPYAPAFLLQSDPRVAAGPPEIAERTLRPRASSCGATTLAPMAAAKCSGVRLRASRADAGSTPCGSD
jgi:hypothetical protein